MRKGPISREGHLSLAQYIRPTSVGHLSLAEHPSPAQHISPASAGDREKALASGCDDFDTKPIEFDRLLAKIEQALAGKEGG